MRTRASLLFAAISILLLPFLISRSQDNAFRHSAPIAQAAFAGHSLLTGHTEDWCECGTENCECGPNETPENHPTSPPQQQGDKTDDPGTPTEGDPNPGPLALLVVLALLVWRFGR